MLDNKPVLFVGAGLSMAAGYPSTQNLVEAMAKAAIDPIDTSLPFFEVADAFERSEGRGALGELLQRKLGQPRRPTTSHRAIAKLVKAGRFHSIVTTNYDPLIEQALAEEEVPYLLQPLEDNAPITGDGEIRILKVHGSYDDWLKVVLSGRAYTEFTSRYPFLERQLYVLLRQHPILFTGYSFQDPRILNWIAALSEEEARTLKQWRLMITQGGWEGALAFRYVEGGVEHRGQDAILKANIRPLILSGHDHIPKLFGTLAAKLAPNSSPSVLVNLYTGPRLSASTEGCPQWTPHDPLSALDFASELDQLRTLADMALPMDESGKPTPQAMNVLARIQTLSIRLGEALTEALLSSEARSRIEAAINASTGATPPLLLLRVHAQDNSEAERRRADRLLSLPWELLRLNGEFPVERGALDIAREAVVAGAQGLAPPDQELTVVATIAAPVDAVRLDYEGESYRLWQAMGSEERRLLITDTGTADGLIDAIQSHAPVAMHFTGHGEPGILLFEDDAARSAPLSVRDLIARLRGTQLPRLAFLASCYSASIEHHSRAAATHRMVDPAALQIDPASSSAAELHREGIHQVVAWLGPVGDALCTRAEEVVYASLVRGRTAREAVREARQACRWSFSSEAGTKHIHPLGWAQLVLYHRGDDQPVALPATSAGPDLGRAERKRVQERMDHSTGLVGVERLKFGFVGRRTVRAELIHRFRDGCRALVIHGLGGLGKTAVCTELSTVLAREMGVRDSQGRVDPVRVVALDGRFSGQRSDPVAALWEQVQSFGEGPEWDSALAELQREGITGKALAGALTWLSRQEGGLLVYLDDAESLQVPVEQGEVGAWRSPALATFWQGLIEATTKEKRFAVLASTRYVPEVPRSVATYPLPVMREIDMVRMVPWWPAFKDLNAADVSWLVERIDGHPRSLQWLDGLASAWMEKHSAPGRPFSGKLRQEMLEPLLRERDAKLSTDLLLPELIAVVGKEARDHLQRCTVLMGPMPWGAIEALEDVEGTGKRLVSMGLLSAFEPPRGGEPFWAPHRVVVNAMENLTSAEELQAHSRLGSWCKAEWEKDRNSLGRAEVTAWHLCNAGRGDAAWEPTIELVLALCSSARYQEALERVDRVLSTGVNGPIRGLALTYKVQLEEFCGRLLADAEERLKESIELVAEKDRAFVLSQLARLFWNKGQLNKAAATLEESVTLEINQRGETAPQVALALHALAQVLMRQGDLLGARKRLKRAIRLFIKEFGSDENPNTAASLHELARVLHA
ncbi:SIR2 family protein, partial [Archangium lipolyticum]|uniref:SIR2 family protein n=1 Tax=Archangium lipolyticum TaxID=2970465 RepID=UPI00214A84C3